MLSDTLTGTERVLNKMARRGGSGDFRPRPYAGRGGEDSSSYRSPAPPAPAPAPIAQATQKRAAGIAKFASQGRPASSLGGRTVSRAPAPSRVGTSRTGTVSRSSGGGGGISDYGSGGGMAGGESVAAPPPISDDEYLAGDTSFQAQLSALARALTDFESQQGTAATQFDTNLLGQRGDLKKARTQGFQDLENDFGARNMLQSGLYGDSFSDLGEQFDRRGADLDMGKANYDTNRGLELGNFKTEQGLTSQRARAEAIARRASSFAL